MHWFPVKQRILFKIAILSFKSLNGLTPLYISNLIKRYEPSLHFHSNSKKFIKKPKTNSIKFGERGFKNAAK